ncbi:MAG: hypothetical protein Q4A01_07640 [Coriobacteriales bacterium]|nr:hypothetical protein [Coriobacteriales bacterium]
MGEEATGRDWQTGPNKYFDANLYLSNEKYSFVMCGYLTLFEDVDGELLGEVVESLRERFPYLYVRAKAIDGELLVVPNPLAVPVRNTWEPTTLGSRENNYHLVAIKHEGKKLGIEVSHCITDGAGYMPYLKVLLHLYLSKRYGQQFNPAGLRLPGTDFVPGELGCPWPDELVDQAQKPRALSEPTDFYQIGDGPVTLDGRKTTYYLTVPASDLMDFCRQNDGSPNAAVAVLLAKAMCKVDPSINKDLVLGVAINKKALLGNYENYHYGADMAMVDFPAHHRIGSLSKACTVVRGQIIWQTQQESVLYSVRMGKEGFAQIAAIPTVQAKLDSLKDALGAPLVSSIVSYTGNRTMGDLDHHIDEFYCVTEPMGTELLIEINCLNHCFYLSVLQSFSSSAYVDELMREFAEEGIGCELVGKEDLRLSRTRYDDIA